MRSAYIATETRSNIDISIIVPIFNAEQFIARCIESLQRQTLANIEIVLVDDGSCDSSGRIADDFASKDPRIVVFHVTNSGVSAARNLGISKAHGRYIGFVDADDWVLPDMYQILLNAAIKNNAQVVFSGCVNVGESFKREERHPFSGKVLVGSDDIFSLSSRFYGLLPEESRADCVPYVVWDAIYERQMIVENGVGFRGLANEERAFNILACRYSNVVAISDAVSYCYNCCRRESITSSINLKAQRSSIDSFRKLLSLANSEAPSHREECVLRIKRSVIDNCIWCAKMLGNPSVERSESLRAMGEIIENPIVRFACNGYPFLLLPLKQLLFFLLLKARCRKLLLLICGIQSSRSE